MRVAFRPGGRFGSLAGGRGPGPASGAGNPRRPGALPSAPVGRPGGTGETCSRLPTRARNSARLRVASADVRSPTGDSENSWLHPDAAAAWAATSPRLSLLMVRVT